MQLQTKTYITIGVLSTALLLAIALLPEDATYAWTDEDGPVESASALFWLAAAIAAAFSASRAGRNGALLIAAFSLGCFVLFGEEISWGQRLIGFETPEAIREINYQDEVNLHNLDFLTPSGRSWREALRTGQFSWDLLLNADKIFVLGYFTYFFLLPFLPLPFLGYPPASLDWRVAFGGVLVASYALMLIVTGSARQDSIAETREMIYALGAFCYSIELVRSQPRSKGSLPTAGDPASS